MVERNQLRAGAWSVTWGLAKRSLILIPRIPSTFVPSMVMPIFMIVAFSGSLSAITGIPGFPARKAIDWFLPMAAIMGGSFAGITTGMGVARDLESGFYDRMLSSPAPRTALLAGPLVASAFRSVFPFAAVLLTGLAGDMNVPGGPAALASLAAASIGMSLVAGAWSLGIALRLKTQQAAPLMQVVLFMGIFLSTAQMPLDLLTGWLHTVARYNPMTPVFALARQGFIGAVNWADTWPGLLSIAGMLAFFLVFSGRALHKAVP